MVTKKRRLYMEMEKVKREEGNKSGSKNETMKVKESKPFRFSTMALVEKRRAILVII